VGTQGTPQLEHAVRRLVPLVASAALERGDRVRAAQALLTVLQGGDPVVAQRLALEVAERSRVARGSGGGRLRRGARAVGDLLDVLNPF
jgi:hypothetical protein